MDKPTTLRLSREQQEAVTRIAERLGVSESAVIRWAVDALLQYAEAHGGQLILPLDLSQQWERVRPQDTPSSRPYLKVAEDGEGRTAPKKGGAA